MSVTIDLAQFRVKRARDLKNDDETLAVLPYLESQGEPRLIDSRKNDGKVKMPYGGIVHVID